MLRNLFGCIPIIRNYLEYRQIRRPFTHLGSCLLSFTRINAKRPSTMPLEMYEMPDFDSFSEQVGDDETERASACSESLSA